MDHGSTIIEVHAQSKSILHPQQLKGLLTLPGIQKNRAISQEEEAMDDLLDCIDNDMSYMGDPKAETKIDVASVSSSECK